ncbi:MAG TPA: dephospho-CoA kinase [Steroidobacteraceae bacterium]|jgi:dephospho-CoA kinase|nr:dephospho-CoA kinase [Steroidobacteraceae bacterium]
MRDGYRVGLTGGIACGKSTVANLFAALGVPIVDTDLLAREVVAPGSALLREISDHFSMPLLPGDGSLDRQQLRARIFADPAQRKWLEERTHPAIRALTDARCEAATGPYVMVAIPLLVETGATARFDRVLVVDCEPALQLARLTARDGATREEAKRMIAAQATREQRLAIANDIIHNDGDIARLRDQVETLHRQYVQAAKTQSAKGST